MNIESIKRRLLVKYPFFGSVVANSNLIAEPSVGTAGTDGKNIYYNPDFIKSITDEQQIFIFAHEICHIAFDHIYRSEGKDKKLWNIATDSVVNAFLMQDGLPIVEGGVDIPEAINHDAEEMYNKLLEEKEKRQQEQQNSNQQKTGKEQNDSQQTDMEGQKENNNDVGHDTHSMWDKAIENKNKKEQSSTNSEKSEQSNNLEKSKENLLDKLSKMFDKKKKEVQTENNDSIEIKESEQEKKKQEEIKKLTQLGEKESFKQNKIERRKQLEELRKSLASQSHGHGNDTNSELRNINNIGISEPLIDWRRLLKEAVKYDIDWSYQNAGIEDGVVTAYLEEMPRPETEIVLDTSGSIDEMLLRNFLRECKNILQNSRVKVGCFDTRFYGFTEVKNLSDIDNLEFYGGGGTNFDVAVSAFTRRVENKIIFTDGEADMPEEAIDAIWIVFGGTKINPKGGKVINISEEQLDKLLTNYYQDSECHRKSR